MTQHDYIVQVIEQFAQLIGRLIGLRDDKRYDEAEQAIGDALRGAFGPLSATLDEVTPECVPRLIDNPEKLELYCALLRESSRIAASKGGSRRAQALTMRVEAIERAAHLDSA
ncbi:MAG: hypothetical protein ACLQVI_40235 [Polyangiaceae bacterium]